MLGAYAGAVIAGIAFFNAMASLAIILFSIISGNIWSSPTAFFEIMGLVIALSLLVFVYAVPACLISAAPFTLICTLFIGKLWAATHRNSVILGSICPLVSVLLFTLVFIAPTTSSAQTEDTLSTYLLPALAAGVGMIPSGAVAGSVFWRMGLRPRAPFLQPAPQSQL